tara:strand:+ start:2060 stop:2674 length:615 start_codon:yes stop_codon:yes gene_type:complete
MKLNHVINMHKGTTMFFVIYLMIVFDNFSSASWIYLALHGTYGILWIIKDYIYPDKSFQNRISFPIGIITFLFLSLYWIAPLLLISSNIEPPGSIISLSISLNIIGVFLHFVSDAQKYYTLLLKKELIKDGFFQKSRNTNYFGEILIYLSFAILSMNWIPFLILGLIIGLIFLPRIISKDKSLARYKDFKNYQNSSGLILPKIF